MELNNFEKEIISCSKCGIEIGIRIKSRKKLKNGKIYIKNYKEYNDKCYFSPSQISYLGKATSRCRSCEMNFLK